MIVEIGQTGHLGDVAVVHASPAFGHFPIAHPAFRVGECVLDFKRLPLIDQLHAFDDL
jgi:hypothetical protein